ncbi:tetratricopeptide repeat-containing diguanylate cyclase [Lacimicrobium alkaliphilum]|uniref:diguanylate cyclase n=1 Tax=Lacimicrobium alkaliphilum TaxID=1526571 RepID=A0A0U3B4L0_9ALTE|nr:tetratricopeptide repeat-containing diguanylate cyclase [Lacimicrobium alkaliphilum]ALS98489.1 hypothetical protein AT746_09600 [Lacimicrobium alkaliphilum]
MCLALTDAEIDALYSQVSQLREQGLMDEADEQARLLLQASESSGRALYQGKAAFALARNHMERNQYPQAKTQLNLAIQFFQDSGEQKWLADSYRQLGLTYRYQVDYPQALSYVYLAMQIYQQLEDMTAIGSAYNSIGLIMEKMGQYEEALQAHQKALEIDYQLDDSGGIATGIYNLGDLYRVMGDHEKALQYFNDALQMDINRNNPKDMAYSHNKVGYVLSELGQHQLAREHISKAIALFQQIQAPRDTDWARSSMAQVDINTGHYTEARELLLELLVRAEKNQYLSLKVDLLGMLADVTLLQEDYSAALEYIEQGIELARLNNELRDQVLFEEQRVEAYIQLHSVQQAFESLQRKQQLDEQLLNEKRVTGIAAAQAQTEFIKNEYKIALLEKERALQQAQLETQQQQRNMLVTGLLIGFVMLFLIYRGYQRKRINSKLSVLVERRTAQLRLKNKELRDAYKKVEALSLTDRLTGLNNRFFLEQHVLSDLELSRRAYTDWHQGRRAAPQNADMIVFMIDLDRFKQINDNHGHHGGDLVLIQFKQRLQKVFRESDYLIRWGGEEFVCVARQVNRQDAGDVARRLIECVRETPFEIEQRQIRVTCSVGFSCYPLVPASQSGPESWKRLLELADLCLYAAKNSGRDCYVGIESASTPLADGFPINADLIKDRISQNEIKVISSLAKNTDITWC